MVYLFKRYFSTPDNEFNTYFKHKMYDYKKGQDLTEDDKIMKMTENNYKSLVRAGEFKACT